jgi:transcriptional regulator with XRE-family HTH domain
VAETRDPHQVALGRTISQTRKEAKLTQPELAGRARISADELDRIEAGTLEAKWGTLRQLAYGMNVELAALLRRAEELERS